MIENEINRDAAQRLYGGGVCPDDIYQWDAVNLSTPTNTTGVLWRTSCDGGMQGALEVNGHFYYGTHGAACQTAPGGPLAARQRYAVFNGATEVMTVTLRDVNDNSLWSRTNQKAVESTALMTLRKARVWSKLLPTHRARAPTR